MDGARIIVPENGGWGSRHDKARPLNPGQNGEELDWNTNGLDAHVNPLYISDESAAVGPPRTIARHVNDW
jgi:hypothetical protein